MIAPTGIWLTIVSYRDFHDVPRLILATDQESKYWIFDSSFDDEQEEYSTIYKVYFAGNQLDQASAAFELRSKGKIETPLEEVPVTNLEFDQTKRRQFRLDKNQNL